MTAIDYSEAVTTLLSEAGMQGYFPVRIGDGETIFAESYAFLEPEEVMEHALGVDEAVICFTNGDEMISFFLVYGNALDETIADHTESEEANAIADAVVAELEGDVS